MLPSQILGTANLPTFHPRFLSGTLKICSSCKNVACLALSLCWLSVSGQNVADLAGLSFSLRNFLASWQEHFPRLCFNFRLRRPSFVFRLFCFIFIFILMFMYSQFYLVRRRFAWFVCFRIWCDLNSQWDASSPVCQSASLPVSQFPSRSQIKSNCEEPVEHEVRRVVCSISHLFLTEYARLYPSLPFHGQKPHRRRTILKCAASHNFIYFSICSPCYFLAAFRQNLLWYQSPDFHPISPTSIPVQSPSSPLESRTENVLTVSSHLASIYFKIWLAKIFVAWMANDFYI